MNLEQLQSDIIQILLDAKQSNPTNAPVLIAPISFEQLNSANQMPRVLVGIGSRLKMTAEDTTKKSYRADANPRIVVQEKNYASTQSNFSSGTALIQWVIEAIKGQTITHNQIIKRISSEIDIEVFEDSDPFTAIIEFKL